MMTGYRKPEAAYKEVRIKSIGISNFHGEKLEMLLAECEIKPHVLQMGNQIIPGCTNPDHIRANADISDFELTEAEIELCLCKLGVTLFRLMQIP